MSPQWGAEMAALLWLAFDSLVVAQPQQRSSGSQFVSRLSPLFATLPSWVQLAELGQVLRSRPAS